MQKANLPKRTVVGCSIWPPSFVLASPAEDEIEVVDDGSPQPYDQNDDDLEWEDADDPGLQEPGGEGQAAAAAAAEAADVSHVIAKTSTLLGLG